MGASWKKDLETVFYAVSLIVFIVGGILWLGSMNSLATTNTSDIKDLKAQESDHTKQFEEIRIRLTHIEDAVGAEKGQ
jgi:hypothetical protein